MKRSNRRIVLSSQDDILSRSESLFHEEQSADLGALIAQKLADVQKYDITNMNRVAAILPWGRSGSLLLASYFDGHEDVITIPELLGAGLHAFFERYEPLPLRAKLLGYPAFESYYRGFFDGSFFDGPFAISKTHYYAAVEAILEAHRRQPADFLESRRAFFLFVHVAYDLALGKPPRPHPMIVYALHERSDRRARYLSEDFPDTKFVHTVRDPISSYDAMFSHLFQKTLENFPRTYALAPYSALGMLARNDRPHSRKESQTRTVRFEDLHRDTGKVLRWLSDWLGLSYEPILLESTFNGLPYVVTRDGLSWSGRQMQQVQRRSRSLSAKDRALLFAVFYNNFVNWAYPFPWAFKYRIVRYVVFFALVLLPMRTEIIAAQAAFKHRILPAVRRGNLPAAARSLVGFGVCRLKIIRLLVSLFLQQKNGERLLRAHSFNL